MASSVGGLRKLDPASVPPVIPCIDLAGAVLHELARTGCRVADRRVHVDNAGEQHCRIGAGRHEGDVGDLHLPDRRDRDQINGVSIDPVTVAVRGSHAKLGGATTARHCNHRSTSRGTNTQQVGVLACLDPGQRVILRRLARARPVVSLVNVVDYLRLYDVGVGVEELEPCAASSDLTIEARVCSAAKSCRPQA